MTGATKNPVEQKDVTKDKESNEKLAEAKKPEKSNKDDKKDQGMSEEDKKLEEDINMLVQRLQESDASLYQPSLESLRSVIRASTTSMTSVPKPLKFMRPHYAIMKEVYEKLQQPNTKALCAELISVLAMCSDEPNDTIIYRMKGTDEPIGDWGHEYVRHLTMGIADEWKKCGEAGDKSNARRNDLLKLVHDIVKHDMRHNAEVEACDLLIEIERLDLLKDYVEEPDHGRVCMYLLSCAPLTPDPDNTNLIRTSMEIYIKFGKHFEAVRAAVMLNDTEAITTIFRNTEDKLLRYQMAILLGRHQIFLDFEAMDFLDSEEGSKLNEFNHNCRLHEYFHALARELDIMEPKTPEQVYKSHLEHTRPFGQPANTDTTRMAMANSIVNGMVNCGYGIDKMMAEVEEANKWFHKSKDYGLLTAAASQGLVWRWDVDTGLTQCDRFLYVDSDFVKAGTYLAIGIISSGIQDPCDPAGALLIDHVHSDRPIMRIGSILGLGLAYANSKRETVMKNEEGGIVFELKKILADTKPSATLEVKGLTGLALGMILVATADNTVAMELLQFLMERSEAELQDTNMRFIALGIALIFLGTQEKSDVFVESLKSLPTPFGQMVSTLVDVCSYAGTGNVLKIQNLLHMCSEHYETVDDKKKKKEDAKNAKKEPTKPDLSSQQAVAVLGIGLIAMGEDIGSQMALRMFGHLIRYGEPVIRRAVPLALSLLSVSNPQLNILETLSKFSHDADPDTAHNAIFAMGLVGAGTNNARLVAMLRQLASYHHKDQVSLMLVRIAQGMTHLGKGTMTLSPFHSDRQLLCPSALAALFTICFTFLDANNTVLNNKQHYLLYTLVLAIQPRMLVTLIEDDQRPGSLKQISVSVRVGQAVDVVAQAGKPKTITGFQTHTTPVLLSYGERAELATEEYISLTPYLEGLVILKKNPEYEAAKPTDKKK